MATTRNSTIAPRAPRIVYQTPEGRVRVERNGPRDYSLFLDGAYVRSFERSWDAEHEGALWLHEQAEQLAAQLADEQADRDAEAVEQTECTPTLMGGQIWSICGALTCWQRVQEPIAPPQPVEQVCVRCGEPINTSLVDVCDACFARQFDVSPVTTTRHWIGDDTHPDAPPAGALAWLDYECGCVLLGVNEDGSGADLAIYETEVPAINVTLATLTQIYTDLGYLLADPRVRAALPAGPAEPHLH